ncbi:class I SAM-dependent methyltransferase [Streptomyces sp. NPDC059456]|uniref:class I SAM-dependent methyltransferase n=1 Tax=Streptomyces sp. NPDC059456 TaxID=3346838 RepID=UPI0036C3AF52
MNPSATPATGTVAVAVAVAVEDIGYGRQFEGWYDRLFPRDESAAVTAARLAELHPEPASGTVEFGVGTGRIALPLARRLAAPVTGLDSSPEMLAALRAAGEAEAGVEAPEAVGAVGAVGAVDAVLADIRTYTSERTAGLVYCVCATLSMLLTPEDQRQAVARAAELLAPGGRFVVETHNKPAVLAAHEGRSRTSYFIPYPEPGTGLQTHSTLLPENDLWHCAHVWFESDGSSRVGTELSRLTTPDEVDAYARAAGLVPEGRSADWLGTPYGEQAPMFVSTYVKPVAAPVAADPAGTGGAGAPA